MRNSRQLMTVEWSFFSIPILQFRKKYIWLIFIDFIDFNRPEYWRKNELLQWDCNFPDSHLEVSN